MQNGRSGETLQLNGYLPFWIFLIVSGAVMALLKTMKGPNSVAGSMRAGVLYSYAWKPGAFGLMILLHVIFDDTFARNILRRAKAELMM